MTTPFRYPDRPQQRLHGPRGQASNESDRPWLGDAFAFRWVTFLTREAWGPFTGMYALDHFVSGALRPGRRNP
jgi:hypothetical protein